MSSALRAITTTLASLLPAAAQDPPSRFDLVLRNLTLIDGSGGPPSVGDLGIRAGRIEALGKVLAPAGTEELELGGLCVAPGFIDLHTHVDAEIVRQPLCPNFLRMGVTTIVTGNCGSSMKDLDAHFARLEQGGIGVNYGSLVGHGTVRSAVLGTANRAPTAEELERMKDLVDAGMRAGAFGLSTGLIYVPGTYAERAELEELARIVGRHGGRYVSHMRNEGDRVIDAIDEALAIGAAGRVPVHISHIKCTGKANHGRAAEVLAHLRSARARGVAVSADQYAYDASSTGLDVLFPTDALAVGREGFARRLQTDAGFRADMHTALLDKMAQVGFGDFRYARIAAAQGHAAFNGLLIPEAAQRHFGRADRAAQADLVIELFIGAAPARVSMVYHTMHERDVEAFMGEDWIAVASDAGIRPEDPTGRPHPRGAGNNPRVLGRYVRQRQTLPLERAIQKMTSVPARLFGIEGRGELRVGAWADLIVFDRDLIGDRATFTEPNLPPVGLRLVFVNGRIAVERGQLTGVRAGAVLRRER